MKTTLVQYFVIGEHTLGYIDNRSPLAFCPLAGSVIRGGRDPNNGPTYFDDDIRPATLADFDAYRVCARYHLKGVRL